MSLFKEDVDAILKSTINDKKCDWEEMYNEYGDVIYHSSCGYKVDLDFAQPTIEHYLYCPFCGKEIDR